MNLSVGARLFRAGLLLAAFMAAALVGLAAQAAPPFNTPARNAILLDFDTGAVLFEKDADTAIPPASMSKLMTLELVFEQLADGSLSLDDKLPVSEKAWRMGGSKMFVEVGKRVRLEDLLQGVIVESGNDACIVLAEGLAGGEEYFVEQMNYRAAELGLKNSHFANATGWPHADHYMSVRDLASLARHIIETFPQYYHFFSEKSFTYGVDITSGRPITQPNRNPLLFTGGGVDGLKTGHTAEAGYGLVASALRDGRRLVLVIAGLGSERERSQEGDRLLEFGYRNFRNYKLFSAGEVVDTAPVWLGEKGTVPLAVTKDVILTLSRRARRGMKVTIIRDEPLSAPITEGSEVGHVEISTPETETLSLPLIATGSAERLGPVGRIKAAFEYLLFGASTGS